MKSLVAVVIPIYKADLSISEEISLRQCLQVLGDYPIIIVKPDSLDVNPIISQAPQVGLVSFDDKYFTGTDAYNELLTSKFFYQAFSTYEYILIYQLDAYVFRNELVSWCKKGYDYIGAPSIHLAEYDKLTDDQSQVFANALSSPSTRVVYNGGLSLRRIPAMLRYLSIYDFFYPKWKGNEDMLFSQEATRLKPMKLFLKLPPWKEALSFAFEKSPSASYVINNQKLPFACHAWERYDPEFWKKYI